MVHDCRTRREADSEYVLNAWTHSDLAHTVGRSDRSPTEKETVMRKVYHIPDHEQNCYVEPGRRHEPSAM